MSRRWLAVSLLLAGCAAHEHPAPVADVPALFGPLLAGSALGASDEGRARFEAAWDAFEGGDLRLSRKLLDGLIQSPPLNVAPAALDVAWTALGAVTLASGQPERALEEFARALDLHPDSADALVGQAAAYHQLGDDASAHQRLARVASVRPDHPGAAVLRAQVTPRLLRELLERARSAEAAGDLASALASLVEATGIDDQDPALFHRLGQVGLAAGATGRAVEAFGSETRLAPGDAEAWLGLGEAQMRAGDIAAAREAFERAAKLPGGIERAREHVLALKAREAQAAGSRPELLQALGQPSIDRAALAALLVARVPALKGMGRSATPVIVTDVSSSWARAEIQQVVALGILEVYDNHTFRPELRVTRTMLAHAVASVLREYRRSGWIAEKPFDRRELTDVDPEHLAYADVIEALRYGVLRLDHGRFGPAEPVSGEEAAAALARLAGLAR